MSHTKTVCEWGLIHTQCRCSGEPVTLKFTICNIESHVGKIGTYSNDPRLSHHIQRVVSDHLEQVKELMNRL